MLGGVNGDQQCKDACTDPVSVRGHNGNPEPEEAVRYLRDHPVDVILTDLSLPDARGLDAVLRLRRLAAEASLLALSGLEDEVIALQAVRLGAQDFCVKGDYGSGARLHRAIRYAIERKNWE